MRPPCAYFLGYISGTYITHVDYPCRWCGFLTALFTELEGQCCLTCFHENAERWLFVRQDLLELERDLEVS